MDFTSATSKAFAKHHFQTGAYEDVRLGILGTARIARNNINAIRQVPGVEVSGIASRDCERSEKFAKEFQIPKHYGSYEGLLLDAREFDCVYIPLPTSLHKQWCLKAAEAGLHILLEKPCALDAEELLEILEACAAKSLIVMDAVFFIHHPRLLKMQEIGKQLGEISFIQSSFSLKCDKEFFENDIRCSADCDPLGCLGDLGWYNIRLALFVYGFAVPTHAAGTMKTLPNGVPIQFTGELFWSPIKHPSGVEVDRTTSFTCSFVHALHCEATIVGTEGRMIVNDFVHPASYEKSSFVVDKSQDYIFTPKGMTIAMEKTEHKTGAARQDVLMWERFRDQINLGKDGATPIRFFPGSALLTQLCVDACLESAKQNGVKVKVDPNRLMDKVPTLYP